MRLASWALPRGRCSALCPDGELADQGVANALTLVLGDRGAHRRENVRRHDVLEQPEGSARPASRIEPARWPRAVEHALG